MADKLLSIIILNWNRKEYSMKTIKNIVDKTTVSNEIILVDNNSKEKGLKEYLSSVKGNSNTRKIECIFNDRNLGVAGGRNTGLSKAQGEYLMTIDDDVLVPDNYDKQLIAACDKVPKLGITGINVEPTNYPTINIGGTKVRPKNGNLGGACLCLPRRIFNRIGYYNYFNLYGMEDCAMYYRLAHIGLISAYIESRGVHLDKDLDKEFRKEKTKAQTRGSAQMHELSKYLGEMRKTGNVYVSFDPSYTPKDAAIFTNDLILKDRK